MGFFSWKCNECKHPLLCVAATSGINGWMNKAVVMVKRSEGDVLLGTVKVLEGSYDGYGRIDGEQMMESLNPADFLPQNQPSCYHRACWKVVVAEGREPKKFKPSRTAPDQGWFFSSRAHLKSEPEPKVVKS